LAATDAVTQAVAAHTEDGSGVEEQQSQEKEEQEWEETNSGGGDFPPSRQPGALIPASPIQVPESG
jgi:hypothetical protein